MSSPARTYPLTPTREAASFALSIWQIRQWLAFLLGLVLIAGGVLLNWRQGMGRGEDFNHLYVMALSLVRGLDVYTAPDLRAVYGGMTGDYVWVPWGVFYQPSAGVVSLPLLLMPFGVAKAAFFFASCAILLFGGYQLLELAAPRLHIGYRVFIIGALMAASATRWAFLYMQAAPLIMGLLCWFVVAVHRRRTALAFLLGAVAVCLKITLALPFFGLAVVQRRYALAAALAAVFIVTNGLGFMRLGGIDAVRGYQSNMATFEQSNEVNYPDFRSPRSMARLDWPYLFNAVSFDLSRSAVLGTAVSAALAGWLLLQAWRCRKAAIDLRTTAAFLGPIVALSLLGVYHHHYDAISLVAPAILYLSLPQTFDRRLALLFALPIFVYAGLYQVGNAEILVERLFGGGSSVYLKLYGVVTIIVAFALSLVLLEKYVRGVAPGVRTQTAAA